MDNPTTLAMKQRLSKLLAKFQAFPSNKPIVVGKNQCITRFACRFLSNSPCSTIHDQTHQEYVCSKSLLVSWALRDLSSRNSASTEGSTTAVVPQALIFWCFSVHVQGSTSGKRCRDLLLCQHWWALQSQCSIHISGSESDQQVIRTCYPVTPYTTFSKTRR